MSPLFRNLFRDPLIWYSGLQAYGWGPSLTIFWWERRLQGFAFEGGWRYVTFQAGQLEVTVQWL